MINNDALEELNDELKDDFNDFETQLNLRYLADEYHSTRSIHVACELADALYDYFNSQYLWYNITMKEFLNSVLAAIATGTVYLIGGFDVALNCLLIAIVLDYISGIIKAYIKKELSSSIGLKGILKKVGVLIIVMLATLMDRVAGATGAIRTLVIYYFVANEGLSILENLGAAGVPIPAKLKKALKELKKEANKNGKKLSS